MEVEAKLRAGFVGALVCAAGIGCAEALTFLLIFWSVFGRRLGTPIDLSKELQHGRELLACFEGLIASQVALRLAESALRARLPVRAAGSQPQRDRTGSPHDPLRETAAPDVSTIAGDDPTSFPVGPLSAASLAISWIGALLIAPPSLAEGTLACAGAAASWLCARAAASADAAARASQIGAALNARAPTNATDSWEPGVAASPAPDRRRSRSFARNVAGVLHARRSAALEVGVACVGLLLATTAVFLQGAVAEPPILLALYTVVGARLGVLGVRNWEGGLRLAGAEVALGAQRAPARAGTKTSPAFGGGAAHVALSNVRFWDSRSRERLDGVSLELSPGEITMVIGEAGSGVAALGRLLRGEGQAQGGQVMVDNRQLEPSWRDAWKALCARVPASTVIVDGTLEANLRRSAPEASETALWAALAAVGLGPWAAERGLQVSLGPSHARLTPGEARRLSLARALLRSPRLLVVEPPLRMIAETDRQTIERCLLSLRALCTIVLLAPDARDGGIADQAVLLAQGRIEESGRVDALLRDPNSRLTGLWAST